MMNELRIGNYVAISGNVPKMVTGIRTFGGGWVYLKGVKGRLSFNEIQPITLTAELLKKLTDCIYDDGILIYFIKVEYQDDFDFEVTFTDGQYFHSINTCEFQIGIPMKYLHELQNRFHSVTGEELTINL